MPESIDPDRPWSTIASLLSGDMQAPPVSQTPRKTRNLTSFQCIKITVLERRGPLSAVVSWCDSTTCCYWDQLWRRGRARKRGFCALTGAQIVAGDDVFRPRLGHRAPLNSDAMILASVMETMPLSVHA